VLHLFRRLGTAWRYGTGGPVGLDWPSVRVIAEAVGVTLDTETVDRLLALERGALRAMHK